MRAPESFRSLAAAARELDLPVRVQLAAAIDAQHPGVMMGLGVSLVEFAILTHLAFNYVGEDEMSFETSLPDLFGNVVRVPLLATRGSDGELYITLKTE